MIKRIRKIKGNRLHVRKGDIVLVLTGNDKGKRGKVLKTFPERSRIVVEGVSFMKRHSKPNVKMPQGGIVERERAIDASNVMVIDPKTGEPTRIGYRTLTVDDKKQRVRYSKKSGETLGG
ncbi:MAG: 50S ribosomal protein L24 [Calditrichaeota bacterium]|jgi:large subunit ribosomal protein L24|nr:50S ribosomal protein L24 [Calditrichota bacterium]MBT7616505.1 50S ribosomal protein L24 [Calditrichota bacterium]MBT7787347.1 50S ribosomal protein L24 [Calditrichota bacterium]